MHSPSSTACLIIIGNEILSGRTADKNLNWLAKNLTEIGINMRECRVIPDIAQTIIDTVNECRAKYTYVFTTGGIGPTHDDITAENVARAFGVPIIRHPEAERRLLAHYKPEQVNEARMKMADVPDGADLIDNPVSVAPGFKIANVYVMAGVPSIMQGMFDSIKAELRGGAKMLSRTLTARVTEGNIAAGLTEIQNKHPQTEIGSYPFMRNGEFGTSIVVRGTDAGVVGNAIEAVRKVLVDCGGEPLEE